MPSTDRIIIDPKICHGRPVIRGTRTPVAVIIGHLAAGDTFETLQSQYDLEPDDIRACLAFANEKLSRLTFAPHGARGVKVQLGFPRRCRLASRRG